MTPPFDPAWIDAAVAEAARRLATFGTLAPFAWAGADHRLDGLGPSGQARLEHLYRFAWEEAARGADRALVVSEGSSDDHPNLLVVFAEGRAEGAFRGLAPIRFTVKPVWFGPVKLRQGALTLGAWTWGPLDRRVFDQAAP